MDTQETRQEKQARDAQGALTRAVSGQSMANYAEIFRGLMAKGIAEQDIRPRENVFTFKAWRALGRTVRRGQHGVKVLTFVEMKDKDSDETSRRPWTTTVFHVSQTDPL
jgi:antirestriction protein ArdC